MSDFIQRYNAYSSFLYAQRSATLSLLKIAIFILSSMLFISHANAYTCRYRSETPGGLSGQTIRNGSQNIQVPVKNTAETGQVNIIDLARYIECRNDAPRIYSDYMEMTQGSTILSSNFNVKAKVRGQDHSLPFSGKANILSLVKGGSGAFAPIPLQIHYEMKDIPGERVAIRKGQTIGSIRAYKYSVPFEGTNDFTWNFIAANDSIITAGGCAINNGEPIDINFGVFSQQQLSSTEDKRLVSRYIPYKCRSNSVNMGIQLSLDADQASFSNALVKTTNSAIGVKIVRGDDRLTPYNSVVRSSLTQGAGGDTFTFSLLKKAGSTPSAGTFTGSATLIMSAD